MTVGMIIAAAVAFNLVCAGTVYSSDDREALNKPVTLIARVDLDQRRWCVDECNVTRPIHQISDTKIMLQVDVSPMGFSSFVVNRESGEFERAEYSRRTKQRTILRGLCDRADFTGFPKRKF